MRSRRMTAGLVLSLALVGSGGLSTPAAMAESFPRGPDPTSSYIEQSNGGFSVTQSSISPFVPGFDGG